MRRASSRLGAMAIMKDPLPLTTPASCGQNEEEEGGGEGCG
jgi:hypothetical protein